MHDPTAKAWLSHPTDFRAPSLCGSDLDVAAKIIREPDEIMSYSGGRPTPLHNGYWAGHDPPNPNDYQHSPPGQRTHLPNIPNGYYPQYQPATSMNQGQYWNQNAPPQYQHATPFQQPAVNGYRAPPPAYTIPPAPAASPAPRRSQPPQVHQPTVNGHRIPPAAQALPPTQAPMRSQPQVRQAAVIGHHVPPRTQTSNPAPTPQPPPTRSQPPSLGQQPESISPAQLFHQPSQTQPIHQYMSPQQIFQPQPTAPNTSARMAPIQTGNVQVDRSKLLMSLAEEFFDAAHGLGPSTALSMTSVDVNAYEKLIATGLGCLDTALKNVKLPPRLEATIRLRYAGVLYEETENFMEAETALSKGIALCDQNHYYDIKYAMQFLLAQLMFKKIPKAALKALDGYISEASTLHHCSWVYALRFLRASYSAESGNTTDTNAAVQNLREIAKLSSDQKDRAVYLTTSLLECTVHLKSSGPDSIEQAQRALAAAWKYQLDSHSQIRQLTALAHILDVVCSIRQGNPIVMANKLREMQAMIDDSLNDPTWSNTDTIAIPIDGRTSSQVVSPDTRMIIGIGDDGRDNLMMPFLNIKDAYSLTYLLAGVVLMHRNSTDHNARKYLGNGLAHVEQSIRAGQDSSGILPECVSKHQWRGQILCYFHIYLAFCAAEVSEWTVMKTHIDQLQATTKSLNVPLSGPLGFFALYLGGIYYQGVGELDAALENFQDAKFDLSHFQNSSLNAVDQFMRDVSLLAALNTIWILQHPDRQDRSVNTTLITRLEEICENHPNKDMQTAYNLVVATVNVNPPAPLIKIKKYLGNALAGAKVTGNTQFICFSLNIMCSKFFSNVVGEQAEKSAMAGSMQAKKSGNVLWMSVAEGMLAQCYDVNGKKEKAANTLEHARMLANKALPNA